VGGWVFRGWGGGVSGRRAGHTNDRRYESNDSREMGKWSMSPLLLAKLGLLLLLLSLDVRER
jgi:hypothetical protein